MIAKVLSMSDSDPSVSSASPTPTTGAVAVAAAPRRRWYSLEADEALRQLDADGENGLSSAEAARRLEAVGPNAMEAQAPPSVVAVALGQLRDPMNLMLVAVAVVSLLIGQLGTGIVVALLVVLNVVLGARGELSAQASVDALAKLQIPQCKVVRNGSLQLVDASTVVPGDLIQLEAGDLVPADGRILRAATLETQEAALTGESAPVSKGAATLPDEDIAIGDLANIAFQNTSVTRGTATVVVTGTGMDTEMGRIAGMLTAVKTGKSPLQRELDGLTKVIGVIAWCAVAVILVIGMLRGLEIEDVLLLGVAMAISAIPTGLPTFVQGMLAHGAKQLAEAKAVIKSLADVETLGATSAINTDKTGTLTLNQMMASRLYYLGDWFTIRGEGYAKTGEILHVAGAETPDFTQLSYGLVLASDATVSDDGAVVGDPTEAALVVLAAKVGVDAEETRRAFPRLAEVPFDSEYKFMATFHEVPATSPTRLAGTTIALVKGAPDVVLGRCSTAATGAGPVPVAEVRERADEANARMGADGLRVLAFALRVVDPAELETMRSDPMALMQDLTFVGLTGIIDPLRPSAKDAVTVAHGAGIDVRMITGDHAVTAGAIGRDLGLGPGAISGTEFRAMSDDEVLERLPNLHVFGRVSPEDKLRLVRLMQQTGQIVAMTGDAVNDAAALKQADIGVAMGSGSEVTKQAGKLILTDDNFGTLVHAVELGRVIYDKIVGYIRYQMSQLISLVLLFLAASVFNINDGVAMAPSMVLFLNFFISVFPVIMILTDPTIPGIMNRPPRDPKQVIANRTSVTRWVGYGFAIFLVSLVPLVWGPDEPSPDGPSASMTMTAVTLGLATVASGFLLRRYPSSGLEAPLLQALRLAAAPIALMVVATELPLLQRSLVTQSLTGNEWLACIGLTAVVAVIIELDKLVQRRATPTPP